MISKINKRNRKMASGLTLIELIWASMMGLIVVFAVGLVLQAGHRNWLDTFNKTIKGIRIEGVEAVTSFVTIGRKSNKTNYKVYNIVGGGFVTAVPPIDDPESVVIGEAVEFHYWDVPLSTDLIDTTITGTAYALFYIDGNTLKLDRGPYPPGAIDESGNKRTGIGISTWTIAKNVQSVQFSHYTHNPQGDGNGCVRMDLRMLDPNTNDSLTYKAATLMRNIWP